MCLGAIVAGRVDVGVREEVPVPAWAWEWSLVAALPTGKEPDEEQEVEKLWAAQPVNAEEVESWFPPLPCPHLYQDQTSRPDPGCQTERQPCPQRDFLA